MQMLKKLIYGILIFFGLFIGIGFFLPSDFDVQREISINASPAEVYPHIADLREWRNWGVWFERDPNMKVTYSGPELDIGMKSSWLSETEGNGEMTITGLTPNQKVGYNLAFPEMGMSSDGELTLVASGETTVVTWRNYGDVGPNPVLSYFAVMMDGMIGPDFESGLAKLKQQIEG